MVKLLDQINWRLQIKGDHQSFSLPNKLPFLLSGLTDVKKKAIHD